jgi:hypothetical protein
MKVADRILGMLLGLLGLICLYEAYRIWVGWDGTGLMALIVGALFIVLSLLFLLRPSQETTPIQWPGKKEIIGISVVGISFALYNQFMVWLGYPISTWLFLCGVTQFISHRWTFTILIWTGAVAVGTYIIFKTYLHMYLPAGFLGI